jgi:indole-3-glycerol phosphate synthase
MVDFLDILAQDAKKTVDEGYYDVEKAAGGVKLSLKEAIAGCRRAPIIAEIKIASPSRNLLKDSVDVESVALAMKSGGAVGISILTEPKHFKGSLNSFIKVREKVEIPLLMKDIIISPVQFEAASKIGANAVLLIETLFERGYCESDMQSMIASAHSKNLEVLLEVNAEDEFLTALKTDADLIGINNRDLRTLEVDIHFTKRILQKIRFRDRIIVSESGIATPDDVRFLHRYGAHAFLVGSAIMAAENIESKVRELTSAYEKG